MSAEDQIQLAPGGLWHRRSVRTDRRMTACGLDATGTVVSRDRGGDKDDHLCPICFGREEIDTAQMHRLMLEHGVEDSALYYGDEEPTIPGDDEESD